MSRNRRGDISLGIALGGFVTMEVVGRWTGLDKNTVWQIALYGFEAGTIGGLADWFAVSALFHEIPGKGWSIPFISRHTNIIVKNRDKIADGAADMVQNQWLTPQRISEKLATFSASEKVLAYLDDPANRKVVLAVIRDIVRRGAESLDGPALAEFLETTLRRDLLSLNLGEPLGRWLLAALENGDHEPLLDACAVLVTEELQKLERRQEIKDIIIRTVKASMERYKDQGFFKRLAINVAEFVKGLDYGVLADKFYDTMIEESEAMQKDREHPLRGKLTEILRVFADELVAGKGTAADQFRELQKRFVNRVDLAEVLKKAIDRMQMGIVADLERPDGMLAPLFERMLDRLRRTLGDDASTKTAMDAWVRKVVMQLVADHHGEVGTMVRDSLKALDEKALVRQIEEKVGDDLQYIRVNGAVVGAAAGVVLKLVTLIAPG